MAGISLPIFLSLIPQLPDHCRSICRDVAYLAECIDVDDAEPSFLKCRQQAVELCRKILFWRFRRCHFVMDGRLHIDGRPLVDISFCIRAAGYGPADLHGNDTAVGNRRCIGICSGFIAHCRAVETHVLLDGIGYACRMNSLKQLIRILRVRSPEERRCERRADRQDLLRPAEFLQLLILRHLFHIGQADQGIIPELKALIPEQADRLRLIRRILSFYKKRRLSMMLMQYICQSCCKRPVRQAVDDDGHAVAASRQRRDDFCRSDARLQLPLCFSNLISSLISRTDIGDFRQIVTTTKDIVSQVYENPHDSQDDNQHDNGYFLITQDLTSPVIKPRSLSVNELASKIPIRETSLLDFFFPEDMLDIEEDWPAVRTEACHVPQGSCRKLPELSVSNEEDQCVYLLDLGERRQSDTVFPCKCGRIGMRVHSCDGKAIRCQLMIDVNGTGIADVGTVLLECHAEQDDARPRNVNPLQDEFTHEIARDKGAHAFIDLAGRPYERRMAAEVLSLVDEIIRVNANAMAADKSRTEVQGIPLRVHCSDDLSQIDHLVM